MTRKILDVGQCNADHSRINDLVTREFSAEIHRAHSLDEAAKMAADTPYDLILINRILDADGSPGMDVLYDLKSRPATAEIPTMIVSNYDQTQDAAIESGAVRGFGKSELESDSTRNLLAEYLDQQ